MNPCSNRNTPSEVLESNDQWGYLRALCWHVLTMFGESMLCANKANFKDSFQTAPGDQHTTVSKHPTPGVQSARNSATYPSFLNRTAVWDAAPQAHTWCQINQHQLTPTSTNQHQSASNSINQYQSASISINQQQKASISISFNQQQLFRCWLMLQKASTSINQHQSASISINQHQSASISISINKYQ